MGGKEKTTAAESDEEIAEASTAPNVEKSLAPPDSGVWFVLEKASLEAAKVGKVSIVLHGSSWYGNAIEFETSMRQEYATKCILGFFWVVLFSEYQ